MSRKIAIGGSAADPPHLGHYKLLMGIVNSGLFDMVIWVPCGVRNDKQYLFTSEQREEMTKIMVGEINSYKKNSHTIFMPSYQNIDDINRPTIEILETFQSRYPDDKFIWYTGSDSIVKRNTYDGKCEIEAEWYRGEELMKNWNFLIINRSGYKIKHKLPDNFRKLHLKLPGFSSTTVRQKIKNGESISGLVLPKIEEYINFLNKKEEGDELFEG